MTVGLMIRIQYARNILMKYQNCGVNIICFFEKNNTFLSFCQSNFESEIVKSDCPIQTLLSFTVCSGDKKSSENDKSTGHFQSIFFHL